MLTDVQAVDEGGAAKYTVAMPFNQKLGYALNQQLLLEIFSSLEVETRMKPTLFEALMTKDNDQRHAYEALKPKIESNPFLKRYVAMGIKEGLFSDSANALGRMHDTMVDSAWPELIGRNIIQVIPTTEALERFPLDGGAVAYQYAESGAVRLSGKKPTKVDVHAILLVESGDDWTKEFSEDATWNVMDRMVGNVGRAVGLKETQKIIALYGAIADADLSQWCGCCWWRCSS